MKTYFNRLGVPILHLFFSRILFAKMCRERNHSLKGILSREKIANGKKLIIYSTHKLVYVCVNIGRGVGSLYEFDGIQIRTISNTFRISNSRIATKCKDCTHNMT